MKSFLCIGRPNCCRCSGSITRTQRQRCYALPSLGRSEAVNVGVAVGAAGTPGPDDPPLNGRGIGALLLAESSQEQADRPFVVQSLPSSSSSRVASGTPSATSDATRLSMAGRSGALLLKLEGLRARMASINKHQRRPTP